MSNGRGMLAVGWRYPSALEHGDFDINILRQDRTTLLLLFTQNCRAQWPRSGRSYHVVRYGFHPTGALADGS